MSSSRLPGKVLADLGGLPLLARLAERIDGAEEIDELIVATSSEPEDDAIAGLCESRSIAVCRGPLDDVLARFELAARVTEADAVVRVTADCPLLDGAVIDHCVRIWRSSRAAYATNKFEPLTYPDGFDVEVLTREALDVAAAEATAPYDREHVTPFVRDHPDRFSAERLDYERSQFGEMHLSVDTAADLDLIRAILSEAGPEADHHRILDVALRIDRTRKLPDAGLGSASSADGA